MGKRSDAIESAKMGLRLDPNNPAAYLRQMGKAYLPDGDLQKSLEVLKRAKRLNPELSGSIALFQSIIYGIQGQDENARAIYGLFLKSRMTPVRNVNDVLLYFPFTEPNKLDRIAGALIKAGAPGKSDDYYIIVKDNLINGHEVGTLLFGRKISGIAMSTGKQFEWEWTNSGEFTFTMGKFKDKGSSWIKEDVLSIQFGKLIGGLPYGTTIYKNPNGSKESNNLYFMVSDIGSITPFALVE